MKERQRLIPNRGGMQTALALLSVLIPLSATSARAADNVHLFGALVAEPCVIAPGDEEIALDFGTVVDKYLYQHTRTQGQPFDIRLTECDLSLGKTVKVTFTGTESAALRGLLAVNGLSGIAIGLESLAAAKPVPLNEPSDVVKLQTGSSQVSLKAYIKGEPQAIANRTIGRGTFSAVATFGLEYE